MSLSPHPHLTASRAAVGAGGAIEIEYKSYSPTPMSPSPRLSTYHSPSPSPIAIYARRVVKSSSPTKLISSSSSSSLTPTPIRRRTCLQNVTSLVQAILGLTAISWIGWWLESYGGIPTTLSSTLFLIFLLNFGGWFISALNVTEKYYDLLGTGSFAVATLFSLTRSAVWCDWASQLWYRQLVISLLVWIWAARLGSFLVARINRVGEDRRFRVAKHNPIYFLVFWMGQVVWISIVGLPVYVTNLQLKPDSKPSPHWLGEYGGKIDLLSFGMTLFAIGFYLEAKADSQKAAFKEQQKLLAAKVAAAAATTTTLNNRSTPAVQPLGWIDTGLWYYSRHPNYVGEIWMWLGISLVALDTLPRSFIFFIVCLLSPVLIYNLLMYVSGVPLLEELNDREFGHDERYQKYKRDTGVLLPKLFSRIFRALVKLILISIPLVTVYRWLFLAMDSSQ